MARRKTVKVKEEGEKPDFKGSIRVVPCDIVEIEGEDMRKVKLRWLEISEMCRCAANLYYQTWLNWHVSNESARKLQEWLQRRAAVIAQLAKEANLARPKGRRPTPEEKAAIVVLKERHKEAIKTVAGAPPVECMPDELVGKGGLFYANIIRDYPELNRPLVTLLMNTLKSSLTQGKAANGPLPKWQSILLNNEGLMQRTRRNEFPIPFAKVNGELSKEGDKYILTLSVYRHDIPGQEVGANDWHRIVLCTEGARGYKCREAVSQILSGETKYCGSTLSYRDGKWRILLCRQFPQEPVMMDPAKKAYLVAGAKIRQWPGEAPPHWRSKAFYLRICTEGKVKRHRIFGNGRVILERREDIFKRRARLNYEAKKQVTMQTSHGRKTARRHLVMLEKAWVNFVRNVNHHTSKDAIELCKAEGIGTLVFCKPNGDYAASRLISGDYKNSTWEFYQLLTQLQYKAKDAGITLEVWEFGKGPERRSDKAKDARIQAAREGIESPPDNEEEPPPTDKRKPKPRKPKQP